ncbi:MAG: hypothetical protein ACOCUS_05205 [Polyangiales bacterium]
MWVESCWSEIDLASTLLVCHHDRANVQLPSLPLQLKERRRDLGEGEAG